MCHYIVILLGLLVLCLALAWQMWPSRCCQHIQASAPLSVQLCGSGSVRDLNRTGFAIIPRERTRLSEQDIKDLLEIHRRIPQDPSGNAGNNMGYKTPGEHGVDIFKEVSALSKAVKRTLLVLRKQAGIDSVKQRSELAFPSMFVHTNISAPGSMLFGWHMDHELFFLRDNASNVLDFWMILEREHPHEAGLQIINYDVLRNHSPDLWSIVKGQGAMRFQSINERAMFLSDDYRDKNYILDFDLSSLLCTPELRVGDILVLPGDAIHRTQPHRSWRTSLRMTSFNTGLRTSEDILKGGLVKYYFMAMTPAKYAQSFWMEIRIYMGLIYRLSLLPFRWLLRVLLWEEELARACFLKSPHILTMLNKLR